MIMDEFLMEISNYTPDFEHFKKITNKYNKTSLRYNKYFETWKKSCLYYFHMNGIISYKEADIITKYLDVLKKSKKDNTSAYIIYKATRNPEYSELSDTFIKNNVNLEVSPV